MRYTYFFLFTILLLLAGCQDQTLEEELSEYCDCRHQLHIDDSKLKECAEMMGELLDKYAYDPEAVDYIETRIQECTYGN